MPPDPHPPDAPSESARLGRLWAKHHHSIAAFVGSMVYDRAEAEELLQEAAAEVFEHAARYDADRPFLPWALGVAQNVVRKRRRTAARDRHVFDQETVARLAEALEDLSERREAMRRALAACRQKLSARPQEICRLRYDAGMTPAEISKSLGVTARSIVITLSHAREQLRGCIERHLRAEGLLS